MKSPLKLLGTARTVAPRIVSIDERTDAMRQQIDDINRDLATVTKDLADLRQQFESSTRKSAAIVGIMGKASALRRNQLRVVFFVHNAFVWPSLAEVYEEMRRADDFDPIVVTIPHHFGGRGELRHEQETHDALVGKVPHLRVREGEDPVELLHILAPDVVFRQSQWDEDIDKRLSTEELSFVRTCLVPYEMLSLLQTTELPTPLDPVVDSSYQHHAWLVFGLPPALESAQAIARRQAMQFRAVGHPKIDSLRRAEPLWPELKSGKPKVFWSSHHSLSNDWNNFGTLHLNFKEMLSWASEGKEQFVWSPHPSLIPFVESGEALLSHQDLMDWRKQWDALPNTATLVEPSYERYLAAAEVVVTDGISLLIEAQVAEKPVVFIERPDHLPFNDVGRMVKQGVHSVRSVEQAQDSVRALVADQDPLAERQRDIVHSLLGEPGAAGRILDAIREQARLEGWEPSIIA